jgi:hypothetical protein
VAAGAAKEVQTQLNCDKKYNADFNGEKWRVYLHLMYEYQHEKEWHESKVTDPGGQP